MVSRPVFRVSSSVILTDDVLAAARWIHGVEMIIGALVIRNNGALTSLGTAFSNLTEVRGYICFGAQRLTNFETLRNLRCHGGVLSNNPSSFCPNCPSWLINLSRC